MCTVAIRDTTWEQTILCKPNILFSATVKLKAKENASETLLQSVSSLAFLKLLYLCVSFLCSTSAWAGSSCSPPSPEPSTRWRTRSWPATPRASARSSSTSSGPPSTTSTGWGLHTRLLHGLKNLIFKVKMSYFYLQHFEMMLWLIFFFRVFKKS